MPFLVPVLSVVNISQQSVFWASGTLFVFYVSRFKIPSLQWKRLDASMEVAEACMEVEKASTASADTSTPMEAGCFRGGYQWKLPWKCEMEDFMEASADLCVLPRTSVNFH